MIDRLYLKLTNIKSSKLDFSRIERLLESARRNFKISKLYSYCILRTIVNYHIKISDVITKIIKSNERNLASQKLV